MSKILDNTTGSPINIGDTGVTVDNVTDYTIPVNDYPLWAASSDIITEIGSGNIVVNDGSVDLSIADGTALIQGNHPTNIALRGDTDGTLIGNILDSLKITSIPEDKQRLLLGQAYTLNIEYALNNAQTVYHSFKTPNTDTRIHLSWKCFSADRTQIVFYEVPTGVVYNFSWTPKNRNRETGNTSACTIQTVTSQTSPGTFITKEANYGSGIIVTQSPINGSPVFLLDKNTEYFFGMTSYAASNLTTLQLNWYEVP